MSIPLAYLLSSAIKAIIRSSKGQSSSGGECSQWHGRADAETELRGSWTLTDYCYRCGSLGVGITIELQHILQKVVDQVYIFCVLCGFGEISVFCHGRGPVCLACGNKSGVQSVSSVWEQSCFGAASAGEKVRRNGYEPR